ncbi:MAG: CoA transferase [Dehalococcoidia bacterium]
MRTADVVVEGFRPGVVKRLGVDHDTLAALNPRIISCSISGYGQDGPYRLSRRPRHQLHLHCRCAGITGHAAGLPAILANLLGDYAGGARTPPWASLWRSSPASAPWARPVRRYRDDR